MENTEGEEEKLVVHLKLRGRRYENWKTYKEDKGREKQILCKFC